MGYLMPNILYTYILNIYDLVCFVFYQINNYWLLNAKSCFDIYIKYTIHKHIFLTIQFNVSQQS